MINDNDILIFLKKQTLDIRKRGKNKFSRFLDQKVTPDVLWVISETIVNIVEADRHKSFTTKDIWNNPNLESRVTGYFNKPSVNNVKVRNEFDKFIGQVVNTLNFAGVLLKKNENNTGLFEVRDHDVLKFIATSTQNSLNFLEIYIEETLKQSGFWPKVSIYMETNTKDNFDVLKADFDLFLKKNTNIGLDNKFESRRIFAKMINPLAYKYGKLGATRGFISKEFKSFNDLQYNAKNWADLKKIKNIPRKEYINKLGKDKIINSQIKQWSKEAKEAVKNLHFPKSEVQDKYANAQAMDPHHIFPINEFPELSYYRENIILLTPTQHYNYAHPNRNTRIVEKGYQKICVLSKIESVETYEKIGFYKKTKMIKVINQGYNVIINDNISFDDLILEVQSI